jgi:hypothetical protein
LQSLYWQSAKCKIFNNKSYVRYVHLMKGQAYSQENLILSWERMVHKDYDSNGSVEKKNSGRESQGTWHQDELTGRKPPAVR